MARRATLTVSLTAHQRKFIGRRVSSGGYQSASEVVREALRLLERRDGAPAAAPSAHGGKKP